MILFKHSNIHVFTNITKNVKSEFLFITFLNVMFMRLLQDNKNIYLYFTHVADL